MGKAKGRRRASDGKPYCDLPGRDENGIRTYTSPSCYEGVRYNAIRVQGLHGRVRWDVYDMGKPRAVKVGEADSDEDAYALLVALERGV